MVGTANETKLGSPLVENARVWATVEEQTLTNKVLIFKKKRRKGYQRLKGHRQQVSTLRILEIEH